MPSWFDGECESQWKSTEKKKFFTVIVVKIYSPSIHVYKNPPLSSRYIIQRQYICTFLDRVNFALYLYAEVTAFLLRRLRDFKNIRCAIQRKTLANE